MITEVVDCTVPRFGSVCDCDYSDVTLTVSYLTDHVYIFAHVGTKKAGISDGKLALEQVWEITCETVVVVDIVVIIHA